MAQKDIAEKKLEEYDDVFADIINALVFGGRQTVLPGDLADAAPYSQYKADGQFHAQERDVAKYWQRGMVRVSLYGIENQTEVDGDMVLRLLAAADDGHDGRQAV